MHIDKDIYARPIHKRIFEGNPDIYGIETKVIDILVKPYRVEELSSLLGNEFYYVFSFLARRTKVNLFDRFLPLMFKEQLRIDTKTISMFHPPHTLELIKQTILFNTKLLV